MLILSVLETDAIALPASQAWNLHRREVKLAFRVNGGGWVSDPSGLGEPVEESVRSDKALRSREHNVITASHVHA